MLNKDPTDQTRVAVKGDVVHGGPGNKVGPDDQVEPKNKGGPENQVRRGIRMGRLLKYRYIHSYIISICVIPIMHATSRTHCLWNECMPKMSRADVQDLEPKCHVCKYAYND